MKKHRGTKIIVILSFVCIIVGSLLLGAGLVQGGSLRYLGVNADTVSWWPFPFGNIGFGIWDEEDNTALYTDSGLSTKELENASSIYVDVDVADIDITRSSHNRISYKASTNENISIQEDDGKISIRLKHNSGFHQKGGKLSIELSDKVFDSIEVECKVGEVTMRGIKTKDLQVKANLGSINLKNMYSEATDIEEKCGEIDIEGVFLGKSEIINKLGSSDVIVKGNPQDYHYEVKNSLGNTEVMGNDHTGSADLSSGNVNAKNYVYIKNSLGDIELEFQ